VDHSLAALFDLFLKERTYLRNVSEPTRVWYRVAFKSYRTAMADNAAAH